MDESKVLVYCKFPLWKLEFLDGLGFESIKNLLGISCAMFVHLRSCIYAKIAEIGIAKTHTPKKYTYIKFAWSNRETNPDPGRLLLP